MSNLSYQKKFDELNKLYFQKVIEKYGEICTKYKVKDPIEKGRGKTKKTFINHILEITATKLTIRVEPEIELDNKVNKVEKKVKNKSKKNNLCNNEQMIKEEFKEMIEREKVKNMSDKELDEGIKKQVNEAKKKKSLKKKKNNIMFGIDNTNNIIYKYLNEAKDQDDHDLRIIECQKKYKHKLWNEYVKWDEEQEKYEEAIIK